MNLDQILADSYVVASDIFFDLMISWNGSATFNVWVPCGEGEWRNTDAFTNYVDNTFAAKSAAKDYISHLYDELSEYHSMLEAA